MAIIRKSTEECRAFILENTERYPTNIAKKLAEKFKISRQAANRHLQRLVEENVLAFQGNARFRSYTFVPQVQIEKKYTLSEKPTEDGVLIKDIKPNLGTLPDNVLDIWSYCFTEIFNNVVDHSLGGVIVKLTKSAVSTEIVIQDDGVGIFKKILTQLNLLDERHPVLELAKGKFTTDPKNHSGEGIF